jgi:hydroxyethylthiazole kinase-like uncharacterized protein yjeF
MSELAYYHPHDIQRVEEALLHAGTLARLQEAAVAEMATAFCAQYSGRLRIGMLVDDGKTGHIAKLLAMQLHDAGKDIVLIHEGDALADVALIIDGLSSIESPIYAYILDKRLPVVALEAPGGVDHETGVAHGMTLFAERTYVLWYPCMGLATSDGLAAAGVVEVYGQVPQSLSPTITRFSIESVLARIHPRPYNSHKGVFGSLCVVAGDQTYFGALLLAVRALIAMGLGCIRVITTPANVHRLIDLHPHIIAISYEDREVVQAATAAVSTILAGPGIGKADWFHELFPSLLSAGRHLVLDAGALPLITSLATLPDGVVLTPHPGEAATLLQCSAADIQAQRYQSARLISDRYRAYTVLKGYGTLVTLPSGETTMCPYGNPGMAVAGMGDVLAALIAGKIAQDGLRQEVLVDAVYLHAYVGDRLAKQRGQVGLEPSQIIAHLQHMLNQGEGND